MKPAFALNLSPDGISLLHRTSRGWLVVGAVALDDPDMPAALGYLRKTALGLAPRGFATKLILPASQILYTAVEAPGPDAANRRRQIARALEGRTPYAAGDLVFDWSGTGGRVNVAVVARETLEEAEAFALEHRFNPVSFVAIPEDGAFAGEPFFGQTAKARDYIPEGERLARDQDPVRISGDADLTRLAASSVAEVALSEVTAPAAWADPATPDPVDEPQEAAGLASDMQAGAGRVDTEAEADIAPDVEPGEVQGAAADLPAETFDTPAPETLEAPVDGPENDSPAPDAAPSDGRAERRRARAERREREAAAEAEAAVAHRVGLELAAAAPDAAEPTEAQGTPPLQGDAPAVVAPGAPLTPTGDDTAADIASADGAAPDAATEAEDPEEAPFLAVEDEPEDLAEATPPLARADDDGVPTPFAAAATLSPAMPGQRPGAATPALGRPGPARPLAEAGTGSVISPRLGIAAEPRPELRVHPSSGTAARASGLGKAVVAAGKMAKAAKNARGGSRRVEAGPGPAAPRARESEAAALTVFGARSPVRGKPRYLGLMLTAGLVVLMLAIALWASLPDGTTDAAAPSADTGPARSAAVEALADPQVFEDVPSVDALEADAMTEAEIAADGGFEAMGPPEDGDESLTADPADLPVDLPEDVPEDPAGTADALPGDAPVLDSSAAPDAVAAAAIAAAGGLVAADIATAAPGVPAATAGGPLPDAAEGLPPRPADPALTERSAEGLPETDTLATDALPAPPQPPLPYGTGFQFGADGMIVPTPDGAMTPEGITVVDGAPARVPPSRPALEAVEAAAVPEADPALIGRKPLSRPAALELPAAPGASADTAAASAPTDAAAVPPPALAADPALAGFKPRTASTVAVAAAAAARNAEAARAAEMAALQAELASATASAVTSSRKPVSRPQDFSQGIAAALAMAATTAPAVAAAAPPPPQAAPAPPAPAPAAAPTRQAAVAPAPEPEELDEPEPVAAAPNIPTTASVAKQATISGAISLREINLIGVYGASSNRRALVRLANGRMLRVKIGDRIDGGQVTAIGEGQLTYQKGGRTHVLRMIQQS